jgi:dihydroflavonol-4-reductase
VSPVAVVTGASGFVGGAVARRLAVAGFGVRGVARSRAAAAAIERLDGGSGRVIAVEGDVLRPDTLMDAFAGADLVVHAAGIVAGCRRDPSAMLRINVVGTHNVVTAAAASGVGRLVHTSSASAIGELPHRTGNEDTPHRGWFLSSYERSKAEAEAAAVSLGAELGLDVVVVNPASVQGPGRMDGTARLLLAAANGRLPFVVATTLSFVDVADCARGHVGAATRGRAGERYVLCGATLRTDDALALVRRIVAEMREPRRDADGDVDGVTGDRPRLRGRSAFTRPFKGPVVVPTGAVVAAAEVVEALFGLTRRDPPICREVAAAIRHGRAYDGSRATRELGLDYTPVDETVRRTLSWFAEIGRLR